MKKKEIQESGHVYIAPLGFNWEAHEGNDPTLSQPEIIQTITEPCN